MKTNEITTESVNPTDFADAWWVFLIQGIASVLIGWLLLVSPAQTTITIVVFLGLYWLISGIVEVIFALFDIGHKGSKWGWKLVGGIIGIVAGIFVLNNPLFTGIITPVMFMYIIAFTFIINGIIHMIVGNQDREEGMFEWSWGSFFLGLFYLVFGLLLLGAPVIQSTISVIFAAGLLAIVGGVGAIILAFKLKGAKKKLEKEEK